MSKSKSSSKATKPAKPDVLTKVKDAAVTKPAQTVKSKSKDIAKQVAGKEEKKDKKSKKKAKEPTPEPSESEDSESSESSESDSDKEVAKPVANGKAKGSKLPAPKEDSSDESDSDSDSDTKVAPPKANGVGKKAEATKAKAESDDSESESDSDESMTDSEPAAKADPSDDDSSDESSGDENIVTKVVGKAAEAVKAFVKGDSDSGSADDSDDESDSSDESDKEEKPAAKPAVKRKAESEAEPVAKKTKTEALDTSKGSNLFVGNLSWNVDEAWLREVFEAYGELTGVRIMTDRDSGRSKGFGYVEFANAEDAAKAHSEKAGSDLDGRALNVDFANARPDNSQKQENRRKSYGDQVSEPSDTLFIGNLSFEVGQEAVTEAFAGHGTILGIRLPTDRETGQPKGFGYVTFASADEAKVALEGMQGAYIEGRPVRLDYSSPRPQNSDSPARGRGGFGGRGGGGFGGRGGGGRGGRGGRGGGRGFGDRGGRGGRGGSTNRGGFGDFSGRKTSFD